MIDGSNTDTVINVGNTDNTAINAENVDNDAINAENTDNAPINAYTSNASTDGKKSNDVTMSNDNTDNATMSDINTDDITTGEISTVEVPSLLCYGRKTKNPSKVKTSKKHTPIMIKPSIGDPLPNEIVTVKVSGHAFDPNDVCIYEFLIQGAPNLLDLEGIGEDQLLEIQ